ncbi:MAG: HPP family protein [Pigmentiphaga sp.]|uniref:HPP family protein n=1 Tax=Pigmentiphaga sp. TaxID=1977564 RepID=UPI0029B04453|nr:HPP family protein [Pigmentiphaga sp.]MDX3907932.1 HPP family protein [Pigmentiphaga sp.]
MSDRFASPSTGPAWLSATRFAALKAWLASFRPGRVRINGTERLRIIGGAMAGVLLAGWACRLFAEPGAAWLVAPLGASAVLVFAVPASPLAQPWSVIGGNTLSTLLGIACATHIGDPVLAAAVAIGGALALMLALRCLHPPGGAAALTAVLAQAADYRFALFPVLVNSVLLVLAGLAYNSLTGRRYPHAQAAPASTQRSRFTPADLDAALAHYNQVLDVSRDDLEHLLHHAEMAAYRRNLGELRCRDIMTREPLTAAPDLPLGEAWELMRRRRIKALPVIDRAGSIVGIVTVADFMRQLDMDRPDGLGSRLRALIGLGAATERPSVIAQIMTRQVRVVSSGRFVIELIPLFADGGHHHIPIIDEDRKLVGIITQTDLVKALAKAVGAGTEA